MSRTCFPDGGPCASYMSTVYILKLIRCANRQEKSGPNQLKQTRLIVVLIVLSFGVEFCTVCTSCAFYNF